jgi:DNA helicase-2/ATP-dependent DNA helicase PcrA
MTLHAAKGLEFETVFLPGWEEGLFPHQRSLDESGLAGLEEERRLAYVGITRAKRLAKISFAQNRRNRGLYQSALPSRFIDELPEAHVHVEAVRSPFGGGYGQSSFGGGSPGRSRFDENPQAAFQSTYDTPGWQRAKARNSEFAGASHTGGTWNGSSSHSMPGASAGPRQQGPQGRASSAMNRQPQTIEGQLVASSSSPGAGFSSGDRIMHQKFGFGTVAAVDGNKLTIDFDHAGRKRVVDSFVTRR